MSGSNLVNFSAAARRTTFWGNKCSRPRLRREGVTAAHSKVRTRDLLEGEDRRGQIPQVPLQQRCHHEGVAVLRQKRAQVCNTPVTGIRSHQGCYILQGAEVLAGHPGMDVTSCRVQSQHAKQPSPRDGCYIMQGAVSACKATITQGCYILQCAVSACKATITQGWARQNTHTRRQEGRRKAHLCQSAALTVPGPRGFPPP